MSTSRLAIVAVVSVGIVILAATQTCRDRSPEQEPAVAKAEEPKGGMGPRASDTPMDLRERDRLREDQAQPAGVPTTPEAAELAPTPAPDPAREGAEEDAEPAVAVGPPASPTIEAAMAAAESAAQDEVAEIRSEMRRKCWDGADRGGKGDGGITLAFALSFDAQGHVLASSVQQNGREDYIEGLEACLGPFAHGIEVPAPGEPVSINVEVELP